MPSSDMKCVQLEEPGSLHLVRKEVPVPDTCEVLLRVTHCALCRTDAKMWRQGHRDLLLPRVLGHEFCGFDPETGKRFVVWPGISCGVCEHCRSDRENLCEQMRIVGFHRDGGLAELQVVQRTSLIEIPENLPSDIACLAEPLACTLNALAQASVSRGDRLLVYGAGPVGLLMALAATSRGAEATIAETNPDKLLLSTQFRKSLHIKVEQNESSSRFDAVINAAPSTSTFIEGVGKVRPGGCFCLFSGVGDGDIVPGRIMNDIHYRQLKVVGAYGCTFKQMRDALGLLSSRRREAGLLLQRKIRLEQVPEAIGEVLSGDKLKLVVEL